MSSDFSPALTDGARQLHLEFSPVQQQLLLDYLALLHKWNRAYNLTAVRDPAQMLNRHLLDSLSIASLVQGQRVLDVGTGPGLPGIPLAILFQCPRKNRRSSILCSASVGAIQERWW